ncbi:EamA family transporter [Calditrichota bacterium]
MGYVYLALMVILTTAGQMFAKKASVSLRIRTPWSVFKDVYFLYSFLCIVTVPFFVNMALDYFELSFVFAFTGVHYIAVPALGHLIFKEHISRKQLIGMLLIVGGVALFG